jgi:hypothetical protein
VYNRRGVIVGEKIMASTAFQNLCSLLQGFTIYQKQALTRAHAYPGMAVASPQACYFAIQLERVQGMTGAALGGALGGALGAMIAGKKRQAAKKYLPRKVPLVEEMDLTALPRAILEHPEWPVTWKEGPVIVVPCAAVKALRTCWWRGGIDLEMDGVAIHVTTPFLKRKKMAACLVDMGWEVAGL